MEQLKAFWKNLMAYVGQMTASQVMLLFGITAGSIVGIVFMVGWLNSVTYARLYSNLNDETSGEIITYLNDNKIPFTITQSGRAIDVPSDKVYQTRISLATEGLPNAIAHLLAASASDLGAARQPLDSAAARPGKSGPPAPRGRWA